MATDTKMIGSDFQVSAGGFVVGGRRGGTLTINSDLIDSRTADDVLWRQLLTDGIRDWSLDLDGMYIEASGSTQKQKYHGQTGSVKFDDGSNVEELAHRTNATLSLSMDTNDATDADSSLWQEIMEGERSLTLELERHYLDPNGTGAVEQQKEIRDAVLNNTLLTVQVDITANTQISFDAKVATATLPTPHDSIVTWTATLENANTPTLTLAGTDHSITAVDTGADTITVSGNQTSSFATDDYVLIHGSTDNDGEYTVSSSSYDSTADTTDIVLNESITDSTADGSITTDYNDPGLRVMLDNFFKDPPQGFTALLATTVTGNDEYTGTGWVTDLSLEMPHDSELTFGGTLTGDGTLTQQTT